MSRQHQKDDVGALGHAARHGAYVALLSASAAAAAAGVDEQLVAGGDQVATHGRAHDAQADETELEGDEVMWFLLVSWNDQNL